MLFKCIYFVIFFFSISPLLLAINQPQTGELESQIQKGIRLSIQQNYSEALAIFTNIKHERPQSPIGYFFFAAVLQTQMMDYEDYENEEYFLSQVDSALFLAKKEISKNKSAWSYFYLGGSYGYLAFYRSKQGKYWQAFSLAQKSVTALTRAVKLDSSIYDAYLGIGTYKYYRSRFSRFFSWLPLIEDEREDGINLLKLAMSKSKYSNYSAMNGLSWILLEEERFDEGLVMVNSALKEFPTSRVFLWAAAKLSQKLGRWQEAANYYQLILTSVATDHIVSPFNQISCRKNLCEIYLRLGERSKALAECQAISEYQLEFQSNKRVAKKFDELVRTCADGFAEAGGD